MSIENSLESIASSLATISEMLVNHVGRNYLAEAAADSKQSELPLHETPAPAPIPAPAPAVPAPAPIPAPAPAVPAPAAVPTPAPAPAPAPAVPAPAASGAVPFTDQKGLTDYCMAKYRALGPVKGGMIQAVLTELGCANIHQLTPDKFEQFYTKVEAL